MHFKIINRSVVDFFVVPVASSDKWSYISYVFSPHNVPTLIVAPPPETTKESLSASDGHLPTGSSREITGRLGGSVRASKSPEVLVGFMQIICIDASISCVLLSRRLASRVCSTPLECLGHAPPAACASPRAQMPTQRKSRQDPASARKPPENRLHGGETKELECPETDDRDQTTCCCITDARTKRQKLLRT